MKKLLRTVVLILGMIFCMTSTVFAATKSANSLEAQVASNLQSLGVADAYIGNMIEYLQCITISSSQENQLLSYVNEAKDVACGRTDLTSLSSQQKLQIQRIAQNAAAVIGLNVGFSRNAQGVNTLILSKSNGSVLLVLTAQNARNVNWSTLSSTIRLATKYSAAQISSSSKSKSKTYSPTYYGGYRKTATNFGNTLAIGFGLISVSAIVLVKRRKAILA